MTQNQPPRMMDILCRTVVCAMLFLAIFCLLQACYPAFAEETQQAIAILRQPENAIVQEEDIATFKVETGDGRYFYEWQRRADENSLWESVSTAGYKGSDTNELQVYAAHPYVDGGYQYRCLVSDASGHITDTMPASLIVWSFDEDAKVLTFSGAGVLSDWTGYPERPWGKEIGKATSIVVEEGITKIGENALSSAGGWSGESATIYLPSSVVSIGLHAFTGEDLARIEVDENNPVFSDIDGVLFDKEQKTLFCKPGRGGGIYRIPDGTTTIADYAFEWCAYYQEFIFPKGVEEIGDYAFSSCHGLQRIVFPEGLNSIGSGTFPAVVRIPASVESIESDFLLNPDTYPGCTEVYYCGTEEQWKEINFYDANSDSDGYIVYFLRDGNDISSEKPQNPVFSSLYDYAGRWVAGEYRDKSMNYERELDIRYVGESSIVFSWRDSGPNGFLQLTDCDAAIDNETGIARFDGQRFYAAEASGWLRFENGTVTLHIDHTTLKGLNDGFETTFSIREEDRLQSDMWFRPTS